MISRSTYGRIPPCLRYSSSIGVSARSVTATFRVLPSLRRIVSVTSWQGSRSPSTPVRSNVSVPSMPSEAYAVLAFELAGQDAHPDEIRAVDALEAPRDDDFDAEELRAFRRPVARRAGAVFFAGKDHERHAFPAIALGGVVNAELFSARLMQRDAAFGPRRHQVLDAHVRECAADHHFVIAAARAERVHLARLVRGQPLARRVTRP